MTTRTLPGAKSPFITPYRVVVSLLLAGAVLAIYIAFVSSKDPDPTIINPSQIVSYEPAEGSVVLRQSRIVAQLKPGFIGVLVIDGVEIPEDQLEHLEGANWVGFTPGEGKEIDEMTPGNRCATVVFWEPELTRATAESFRWCWNVH